MQRLPYLGDPKLIPRVQKYLEANVDKTYIDIGLMADELQNTYREYSRRKRNAFRASVKKAYSIVLRSYGLDDQSDDSSEEKVDEEAESENSRENHFHNNIMNNQLVELYTRSSSNVPKMNENELIDISSDDSKEEGRVPPAKSSNGPSTSSKPTRIDFSNNFQENMEKISALQGKKRKMEEKSLGQTNKKKKIEVPAEVPQINLLDNVVGIDSIVNQLVEDLLPFKFPHVYLHSDKVKPPRGFLLHGLSGCGKTFIATAIAGHLGFPFIQVCASELASGISGDTEKLIRELFKRAVSSAPCVLFIDNFHALMNDQTNSQQPKMKNSVIAEICHCIDELDKNPAADRVILIAATTNLDCVDTSLRADGRFSEEIRIGVPKEESRIAILKTLTSSFKLAPDFDWNRIAAETPGYVGADLKKLVKSTWRNAFVKMVRNELANSRNNVEVHNVAPEESDEIKDSNKSEAEIIVDDDSKETTEKGKIDSSQDENLVLVIEDENSKQEDEDISSSTVPTEINSLGDAEKVTETPMEQDVESEPPKESTVAPTLTLSARILEETGNLRNLDQLVITENDFLQAAKQIKPLAIKQGLCTVPKVCWDDIGSLQNVRNELKRTLLEPIKRKKAYEEFGIDVPAGVLLCGPPGCGKTLLAKALANEANLNFFSVKGPEVINMYVGESEKAVRKCFEKAKNAAPSLIFFDELDALCPRRKANGESDVISRIVNAMLIEMDGVEDRDGVYLLAATNRPDIIDNAVLRPGRLDKILYVGIPTAEDRVEILRAITKNGTRPRLGPDVDLESIGRLDGLSRYTGADLSALVKEASRLCIERTAIGEEWILNSEDFHRAISKIRPSITEEDKQHYDKMKEKYNNGAT